MNADIFTFTVHFADLILSLLNIKSMFKNTFNINLFFSIIAPQSKQYIDVTSACACLLSFPTCTVDEYQLVASLNVSWLKALILTFRFDVLKHCVKVNVGWEIQMSLLTQNISPGSAIVSLLLCI